MQAPYAEAVLVRDGVIAAMAIGNRLAPIVAAKAAGRMQHMMTRTTPQHHMLGQSPH